jgi:hypothetical protein
MGPVAFALFFFLFSLYLLSGTPAATCEYSDRLSRPPDQNYTSRATAKRKQKPCTHKLNTSTTVTFLPHNREPLSPLFGISVPALAPGCSNKLLSNLRHPPLRPLLACILTRVRGGKPDKSNSCGAFQRLASLVMDLSPPTLTPCFFLNQYARTLLQLLILVLAAHNMRIQINPRSCPRAITTPSVSLRALDSSRRSIIQPHE